MYIDTGRRTPTGYAIKLYACPRCEQADWVPKIGDPNTWTCYNCMPERHRLRILPVKVFSHNEPIPDPEPLPEIKPVDEPQRELF